jgi:hypothetical protein
MHCHRNLGTRNNVRLARQRISESLTNITMCTRCVSALTKLSSAVCSVDGQLPIEQRAMSMQPFGAVAIASVILYVADQFLWAGRHSGVVGEGLKHIGWLVGIHI